MDTSVIYWALFLGIASEYMLRNMILMERESHEGPFRSSKSVRKVRFAESGHTQHVAMFDWIRRLFGVYDIQHSFGVEEWVVYEHREQVERFTCQHCLSWWVCLPFSIGLTLAVFGASPSFLIWIFPIHCFMAVISQVIYKYLWE